MITTGHSVRGFSPVPGIERDCVAGADAHYNRNVLGIDSVEHEQSVVDIGLQMGVDCVRSFKGEVLGVEPFSSALFSANIHGILGSDSCKDTD